MNMGQGYWVLNINVFIVFNFIPLTDRNGDVNGDFGKMFVESVYPIPNTKSQISPLKIAILLKV